VIFRFLTPLCSSAAPPLVLDKPRVRLKTLDSRRSIGVKDVGACEHESENQKRPKDVMHGKSSTGFRCA
jgi:hypothetical protein